MNSSEKGQALDERDKSKSRPNDILRAATALLAVFWETIAEESGVFRCVSLLFQEALGPVRLWYIYLLLVGQLADV